MAEKKSLAMQPDAPKETDSEKPLKIRRGRVESVDIYEIKDSELEILEKGSPADLQLNFSIFLLSVAFSGICVMATVTTFRTPKIETIFTVVTIVGLIIGLYLLIAWYRNRKSLTDIANKIRQRIPPDIAASAPEKPVEKPSGVPKG